jgi:hypothetical protein
MGAADTRIARKASRKKATKPLCCNEKNASSLGPHEKMRVAIPRRASSRESGMQLRESGFEKSGFRRCSRARPFRRRRDVA